MKFLELSQIDTSERQRKFFDEMAIVDLADSIAKEDLIHAPCVLEGTNKLIAGERRLRAIELLHKRGQEFSYQGQIIPPGMVPVTLLSSRDLIAQKEAELAENLFRKDLTWQEQVAAERELRSLREAQTGKEPSLNELKEELEAKTAKPVSIPTLSEDMFLSKYLDDPDVAKEKDRRRALALARNKAMEEKRALLREKFELEHKQSESPHRLLQGDMKQRMRELADGSVDLLLTDPPYGVDARAFNDQFLVVHEYADDPAEWEVLATVLAIESFRVCKPQAHAFVFCDIRKWPLLSSMFSEAGWIPWPRPLIWDKGSIGALPRPKHGPRLCYEAIMFATKGNKETQRTGRDVLQFSNVEKTMHAAEKPVGLFVELIGRTCEPGGVVLDPFAGSGTIFPAANQMAVKAIGIEVEEVYINCCLERMAG